MKSRLALLCISLSIFVSSINAVCANDTKSIRVGVTKDIGAASLYIADAKGYFRDEGLVAELRFFDSAAQLAEAAGNGTIDFGMARLDAPFFVSAAKNRLKVIASEVSDQALYPTDGLLMTKKAYRDGLRDPRNFPDRRVGVLAGFDDSGTHYSLARIAAKYKFDPAKLNLVRFDTAAEGIAALSRGDVDTVVLPYVTARQASQTLDDAVVMRFSDFIERQAGVVFARAELLSGDRGTIEKFLRAYRHGVEEYDISFQQHDDEQILAGPNYREYLGVIAGQTNLPELAVQNALPYCDHLARLDLTDFGRQLRFWQREGKADKNITAGQLLDTTFFEHISLPETEY
jgi:NitT/TauT family transport system substrate-binding protein